MYNQACGHTMYNQACGYTMYNQACVWIADIKGGVAIVTSNT